MTPGAARDARGGRRRRGVAVSFALAAALLPGGCRSGPAPADRHYRLEASAPAAPLATPVLSGTLVVERPRSDALTGERRILYRAAPDSAKVSRHAYSLWVDSPTSMIQSALVRHLREARLAERVVPPELDIEGEHELTSRLSRLERVLGDSPYVELELDLALRRVADGSLVHHGSYRAERPIDGAELEAGVRALGVSLGELLDRFVVDVAAAVGSR